MIIFGIKHFRINSFSAQELGLTTDTEYDGVIYEVREEYLHIFWIPIITMGRHWFVYENAQYTECSISLTKNAKQMGHNISLKWYASTGAIILLSCFVLIKIFGIK
jgi:hypothetical protein